MAWSTTGPGPVTGFLVVAGTQVGTIRKGKGQERQAASCWRLRPPELVTGSIQPGLLLENQSWWVGKVMSPLPHGLCAPPHVGEMAPAGQIQLSTECHLASPGPNLGFQMLP